MSIFDLDRNQLLSVLKEYTAALAGLEWAMRFKEHSQRKVNHPYIKGYLYVAVKVYHIVSVFWIPGSFLFGFIVLAALGSSMTEDDAVILLFGLIGALLTGFTYIFIRKKMKAFIDNKFENIWHNTYGSKQDFENLQENIDWEKNSQDEVDELFRKYSMPEVLRWRKSADWIYEYLLKNDVSLEKAINAYDAFRESEIRRIESNEKFLREMRQERREEERARHEEEVRKELRRQSAMFQEWSDRDYIRGSR